MLLIVLIISMCGCSMINAQQFQTSPKVFAGNFSDPNHPGCPRTIQVTGMSGQVYGSDAAGGKGAQCDGKTDVPWGPLNADFEIDPPPETGIKMVVDFSPKGMLFFIYCALVLLHVVSRPFVFLFFCFPFLLFCSLIERKNALNYTYLL
jgi:hypothetical protein